MVLVLLCLAKDRLVIKSLAVILTSLDTQIHVTTVRIIAESYVAMTVTTLFHAAAAGSCTPLVYGSGLANQIKFE